MVESCMDFAGRTILRGGIAFLILVTVMVDGEADNLEEAHRLLKATSIAEDYEQASRDLAAEIVRTYASIIASATDVRLPLSLQRQIAGCYAANFAWERFENGIAQIFADNMSTEELALLIDFFSDRSIPPPSIGQFRVLIAKADIIEQLAVDFIFRNSEGCDEKNVALILAFLASYSS